VRRTVMPVILASSRCFGSRIEVLRRAASRANYPLPAQGNRARWKSCRWRHGHRSETSLPSARSEVRTDLIFSLLPQRQFTERSLSHPGAGSGS